MEDLTPRSTRRQPTLTDLTAFSAVARHRSFRQAADELGVSASALSHTLRILERDLGVRLLHRTTRSVALTEAGEHLLRRLDPALRDLRGAISAWTASARAQAGRCGSTPGQRRRASSSVRSSPRSWPASPP
jgi:DNA-binding transcriptional LysR family regulator